MKFTELNLHPDLLKGIQEMGFEECTPVQERAFSHTLNGKDVYVQSQTGTGKTAAFLITMYQIFMSEPEETRGKAMILVPTRELAIQIEREALAIGKYLPVKVGCFYGGVGYAQQDERLKEGVNIFIGTPGRIIDYVKNKKINLGNIDILVIDEADRMFDMGFIPDIRYMIKKMPQSGKRHTMLFSATLTVRVRNLAWQYMNEPEEIEISPENVTVANIKQSLYHVGAEEKMPILLGILKSMQPRSMIVFANTKQKVVEISKRLELNGYPNQYIIGDLPQKKRQRIIDDIKDGKINFLIATDVAARGLHVDDLELVVNYDLPEDSENYVHRIGRTARAGKSGTAISLACERFVQHLEGIEQYIGHKIDVEWAEEKDYAEDASAHLRPSQIVPQSERDQQRKGKGRGDNRPPRRGEKPSFQKPKLDRAPSSTRPSSEADDRKKPRTTQEARPQRDDRKRKRDDKRDNKRKQPVKKPEQLKNAGIDDRLQYYKEKYGEDFKLSENSKPAQTEKKSIWKKITSVFKK